MSIYGTLTVDGGSLLTTIDNTGSYKVGLIYVNGSLADHSTITVMNGGSVSTTARGNIVAGLDIGTIGTLTVTGVGSSLSSGFLQAGNNGDGTINILDGATARATVTLGANFSGTTGAINLSGAGSTLTTGMLYINADGDGVDTISDGARAIVNTQVVFGSQGGTYGELNIDSGGTLSVGGVNRIVDNEGAGGSYLFRIDNGTLENIQSDLVTSVNINVVNTATIQTNSYLTALYGQMYGTGSLNKTGAGTLLLTADNTYAGATTIAQGVLQLGNGGTTGSIAASSAIHDNGSLIVDHSNMVALSQVIDGTGSLTQNGTGTLLLSADNTYTGATTIAQGGLQLGNGGTTGSIAASSAIHNNGSLIVDHSNMLVLSQAIDGTGSLTQNGTGTLVLSADNTYTGATTIAQGTLQLGNGSTTGSIASTAIHDNGSLVVDRSDTLTLSEVIDGTGNLTQNGTGTLVLSADNTYTGATTIAQGGLQLGNGGTTGSIAASSAIHDNGSLIVDHSNMLALSQVIDGTGSLTQNGTGTLVLSADNTYTGTTTIAKGTLQLGNGGTTGSIAASSAIHDNGSLIVDHSNMLALSQVIDGTGSLTQNGTGTLVLSADNTYTGTTTIAKGTLQLGNGGTTGSIAASSAIHDNGSLIVDHSDTVTLAQVIDGTGSLSQAGRGTTVLSADNTYTGATTVENGTLDVEGSIASSAVTVLRGSTLAGTGSVGNTLVAAGATLAPTGVTGVLGVQGNLQMADGAILSVHDNHHPSGTTMVVNGQTYEQLSSGTVAVTGSTALTGTLNVNVIPGTFLKSHQYYTLISSTGGFSGKADMLRSNLNNLYTFLMPSLYYSGDDLDLLMYRNNVTFSSVVQTRNQREVGRVLDTLPESNALVQGMESLDAAGARQSMNALSGEVYASARTALIQDSVYVRQAALDRLETADCQEGGMGGAIHTASLATGRKDEGCLAGQAVLWGEAYGGLGHNNGDGNAASMHHSTTGFIMGLDTPIMDGRWRVGGLFSYGRSMFDIGSGRGSSGHSNNITVGGYAGTHWGALSLKLGAAYTWNMLSLQRNVAFSDYSSRQSSSYSGGTVQAFGELGYRFHTTYGTVEPFGHVAYVNLATNGYQEEGGAAALQGRGMNTGVTFSTFGVKMFKTVRAGNLLLLPHGSLAYRRAFGLLTPTNHTMLASAGGSDMDVAGVALSQDSAVVDAGVSIRLTDRIDIGLSYIGQYGNRSVESGATGSAHFRF
ncbi:autotransporter-associated beta strand repeat-containing protein [Acetobacter sp.]|uniref:autotransporter outer membrane beta-barrel domain-containing protein n=1 Tax=Acetobacter sp. TaxID=440 RepID=UPI0039EB69A8